MIVTTTNVIEGRPITEYIGVVSAQSVLGVNAFKDVAAGMRNVFGGRSKSYENELTAGVSATLEELEEQAKGVGADALAASTSTTRPWATRCSWSARPGPRSGSADAQRRPARRAR